MLSREQIRKSFDEAGVRVISEPVSNDGWQSPASLAEYGLSPDMALDQSLDVPPASTLQTTTPSSWKGTKMQQQEWLADGRIPAADITIYAGNGGSGKTETAVQLLAAVAHGLGDWLGCVIQSGTVLFLSCEEPEDNIRDRKERFAKHRGIDPHADVPLHIHYPELDASWLVSVDRSGKVLKSGLFDQLEAWMRQHRPRLVVIDSIAAVFDGEAIARRQVRTFLAMLRKLARDTGAAIVLLDHPSVRGQADGSGTAGSVDWRNSVRSMLYLSDPPKDDPDSRELEVKKSNRGRTGEKVRLRWNGLTFVPEGNVGATASPHRAAAERIVDDLFLKLLDKRLAQGRPLRPSSGRGSAPSELADDPEANGTKASAFKAAMERLFTCGTIVSIETGPPAKRVKHIERASRS